MMRMRPFRKFSTTLALGFALGATLACSGGASSDAKKAAPAQASEKGAGPAAEASAAAAAPAEDLPDAKELFAAHIEAVGGQKAIDAFETLYFESSVDTGAQNIKAKAKTWWKGGHFLGEQEIPGFGVAKSGYDGTTVWVDDPINGLRKVEGKEAEQYVREGSIFLVSDWESHFRSAETVGAREVDGRKLYDVKLTSELGDEVTMSFADDDKLLAQMKFQQITPTGNVPVTAVFSEYGDVAGVKFAHKSTLEMALGSVSQTYDKIEVNPEIDESRFAYPGAAGAVGAGPEPAGSAQTPPDGD
jgi:hypothetical protein